MSRLPKLNLQFFGGGGTEITQVENKKPLSPEFLEWMEKVKGPAEEWLLELQNMEDIDHDQLLKDAQEFSDQMNATISTITGDYIPSLMANQASFVQDQKEVYDDYQGIRGKQDALWGNRDLALEEMHQLVKTGQLPAELAANMYKSINSNTNQSMGSLLSDWAKKGVVNSSTSQAALKSLDRSTADAMAKNWTSVYDTAQGAYGNLIGQYNDSSNAYTTALNADTGMLGALTAAGKAQGDLATGWGSTISALTGASTANWENAFKPLQYQQQLWQPAYEIWSKWYDEENEPDYDTVVSQGGK